MYHVTSLIVYRERVCFCGEHPPSFPYESKKKSKNLQSGWNMTV